MDEVKIIFVLIDDMADPDWPCRFIQANLPKYDFLWKFTPEPEYN